MQLEMDPPKKKIVGESPMIDLVVAVDDAEKWHAQNLKQNPKHYSILANMGSKAISQLQVKITWT